MHNTVIKEYWRLQKAANLSNAQAAEYLGVSKRTIERYRAGSVEAPKAVLIALKYKITEQNNEQTRQASAKMD